MGTSSGEFWKYSKFEIYQEFWELIGNLGKFIKLYHCSEFAFANLGRRNSVVMGSQVTDDIMIFGIPNL